MRFDRRTVLVCEDCDEDFDTLTDAARKSGLTAELCRATTGEDCLRLLRGAGGKSVRPAMVLMDLDTPGIDGREALREIKADPDLRKLPVIVFTTSANPKELASCYHAGANAYHVKPTRYDEHISILVSIFTCWIKDVFFSEHQEGIR